MPNYVRLSLPDYLRLYKNARDINSCVMQTSITVFRISTVPFARTTPTAGFPDLKSNVPAGIVRSPFLPSIFRVTWT
jgi:hypothetical protein